MVPRRRLGVVLARDYAYLVGVGVVSTVVAGVVIGAGLALRVFRMLTK